jgi:hypothetical protein
VLARQRTDDTLTLVDVIQERDETKAREWTVAHELLAQLIELIGVMRIESWLQQGVPRWKLPEPLHVPRPGEKAPEPLVLTPSQFARLSTVA